MRIKVALAAIMLVCILVAFLTLSTIYSIGWQDGYSAAHSDPNIPSCSLLHVDRTGHMTCGQP
jgi:hypothetical protein